MTDRRDSPSLAEVLRRAMERRLDSVHVAIPGKVLAYDSSNQSVTVQPLIRRGYLDESGARIAESLPAVPRVPVVFPGAGGFRVTFPVAKGDTVLLVIASQSLDQWLSLGDEVDPRDDRRHALSDAVAIPGLRAFSDALGNAPTDRMSVGNDTGPTIEIESDMIRLGSIDADDYLALKSDVQTIRDELDGHSHTCPNGGGSTTNNPSVTAPTGTTKVKAE